MMKRYARPLLPALLLNICCLLFAGVQQLRTRISVHDPVMIRQDSVFHLYATGNGIASWSSTDLLHWKAEKPVFASPPQWAVEAVPGFKGHIWAPDISYHNGLYYLYYSVSAFGKNTSCIGVATNPTLDAADSAYKWTDHGKLIQSIPGKTNWNAIDPNLITEKNDVAYLVFGSFWGGLQITPLSEDRLHLLQPDSVQTIATRVNTGENAIEAPFVFRKGKYYYLFASIDYCCKGPKSTYKMIVGRSKRVKGPFLDKDGNRMDRGGGSLVLQGDSSWYGVGHNGVCSFDNQDYLVFHGYDAADNGRSKLIINKVDWQKGWPVIGKGARNLAVD